MGDDDLVDLIAMLGQPTDFGEVVEVARRPIEEWMSLADRVDYAKNELSCAIARGECACCAEGWVRSKYVIPEEVQLVRRVERPVTETRYEVV